MHTIDIYKLEFKGAAVEGFEKGNIGVIGLSYMLPIHNSLQFRLYCIDNKTDGLMLRDDGKCLNIDADYIQKLTSK